MAITTTGVKVRKDSFIDGGVKSFRMNAHALRLLTYGDMIGARWRRGIVRAVIIVVLAALIVPAVAGAVPPQEIDDLGNTGNDTTIEVEDPDGEGTTTIDTSGNTTTGNNSCGFTVRGHLVVRDPTVDGLVDNDPLEDVEVKVSGRSEFGVWNEWDTERTDENGDFSVWKGECSDRKVKVEARFKSDDLRVTSSASTDWYLLFETSSTISWRTLDIGDEPFGGGVGDQSTSQARTDAQTWAVFQRAIDYTASIGRPFLNKVTVHNPATLTVGLSATDPILQDIHIDPNDTADLDTWLHELGHAWMYPHVTGENCLTWNALITGSTHDQVETPCVAASEGITEFLSNKLEQEMNTEGLIASTESPSLDGEFDTTTPMNRAELNTNGLVSLSSVETNELGWDQAFRVLTSPDITRDLFGPGFGPGGPVATYDGPSCASRGMPVGQDDLADALFVIGDSSDEFDLRDSNDPSVAELFDRAADRLGSFDVTDSIAYLNAVDPTLDSEPHEAYGC